MKAGGEHVSQITKFIEVVDKPVIDRVFPFKQTNEAMKYVENGHTKGKLLLRSYEYSTPSILLSPRVTHYKSP